MIRVWGTALGVALTWLSSSTTYGVILAEFDFEAPANGDQVTNLGVGPDGILTENASIADGVLNLDNLALNDVMDPHGVELPLGVLNPFGGGADWRVAFDFSSEDGGGPLFSSDSGLCEDECNDAEQAGSLNIFLTGGGEVVADAWFIGAIGSEGGLNDGETHRVELAYTAAESLWELFVNDELAEEATWEYTRDPTFDRTRIGGLSNPDFGFEIDEGMDALAVQIDNFVIEAPSPPPVLATIDRATGAITVDSIVGDDLNISEFAITSSSGSLNADNWTSISGNYDSAGDSSVSASAWSIGSQSADELSEAGDAGTLVAGQSIDLGTPWLPSPLEDVRIAVFDTDQGELIQGAVSYTGDAAIYADLNSDGELNSVDWELFVAGFGSDLSGLTGRDAYFLADLTGDGVHDAEDFIEFSIAYDEMNGEGAMAALAGVPEPGCAGLLACGLIGLLAFRRRSGLACMAPLTIMLACAVFPAGEVRAELLAEYTFDSNTNDSSGNGHHGTLDEGIFGDGAPEVSGGVLQLTGEVGESMIIPIEDVNPFDGTSDFTIDVTFRALPHDDDAGHLLISSADFNNPAEPENHSMSVFIEPEGDIVYDNFFIGEVRLSPPEFVIDEAPHELRVTFDAPDVEGDPGTMFMRLDGTWLGVGEIAPSVPGINEHEVRLGSSLNEDFPFECAEGECFIREFLGDLDDVRIYDEAFVPTQMSAEVDRATGDIRFVGGEFARDIKYYELSSEAGALNSAAWGGGNFSAQDLDAGGDAGGLSWDTLTGSENRLVEAYLLGSSLFADGTSVTLPGTWNGGAEDLSLEIVTSSNETLNVAVNYVGEGSGNPGGAAGGLDCNGDGSIDALDLDCTNAAGTTAVLLAELGLLEGDTDGDGSVGFPDFLVLSANFGQTATYAGGDIDADGTVGFSDFLLLSANFGQAAGVAAVPEPASGPLLCASCLSLLFFGRRRR